MKKDCANYDEQYDLFVSESGEMDFFMDHNDFEIPNADDPTQGDLRPIFR